MATDLNLLQVLYTSRVADGVPAAASFAIVDASMRENRRQAITGFLLEHDGRFLQFLEGPPLAVEAVMAKIERDSRHEAIEIRMRAAEVERCFPDWSMKQLLSFSSRPAVEELQDILAGKRCAAKILEEVDAFIRGDSAA